MAESVVKTDKKLHQNVLTLVNNNGHLINMPSNIKFHRIFLN